ncbi:MAG: cytochrome c [Magnetococcales bacterium]|nr:cytochrome c [Magnetococcales bacterium]
MGALVVVSSGWAAGETIPPARQMELFHLLRQDCGSCHGMTLKGGLGPALLPGNLAGKPADLLEDIVYHGLPERAMPPWEGLLTRQEIRWLVERLIKGEVP